jgi:purine-binding chemotaxis protein CheW
VSFSFSKSSSTSRIKTNRSPRTAIPTDLRTRLIVVRSGARTVGLVVDSAREFVRIPAESIQPPPEGIDQAGAQYLAGIAVLGERLVLILDVELLLLKENDTVAATTPQN